MRAYNQEQPLGSNGEAGAQAHHLLLSEALSELTSDCTPSACGEFRHAIGSQYPHRPYFSALPWQCRVRCPPLLSSRIPARCCWVSDLLSNRQREMGTASTLDSVDAIRRDRFTILLGLLYI